jgi:uroporphyrinogen-III decarboxylase
VAEGIQTGGMGEMKDEIEKVLNLLQPNSDTLKKGTERQKAVWENRETDYLPLLIGNMPIEERKEYPSYNKKERFYSKEKMLMEQAWGLISTARAESDAQLCAPVDLGAGFIPSILGLEQMVFKDKDPWLKDSLSKQEISKMEVKDMGNISEKGLVPRAIEYTEYFREKLGGKAQVCLCGDMFWGPFSIAHLIRRDEIFTDLYDDPPFVHHLMEIATYLYVEATKLVKRAAGEPLKSGCRERLYIGAGGGVMCNEDTIILLSPSHAEKFVYPYLRKAFKAFGGALVHFCGDGNHLLGSLLDIPEVKGINFGDPREYNYGGVMEKILEKGKFYYGGWPRREGEDTKSYFKRILEPLGGRKRGLILSYGLTSEERESPKKVMELWHSLQA